MRLSFWRYEAILFLLYFLWSGVFTAQTYLCQAAFNFAVFYPVGVLAGYFPKKGGIGQILLAAFIFDLLTYGLLYLGGLSVSDWGLVALDFISMILLTLIGVAIGGRMRGSKGRTL